MNQGRGRLGLPILALLPVLLTSGCDGSHGAAGGEGAAERAPGPKGVDSIPVPAADLVEEPAFFDITATTGIDWVHNRGASGKRYLPETLGPGVVIFDADGDDRLDVLLVNGRNFPGSPGEATPPALFLNQGGFRFRNATSEADLDAAYCLGGVAADYDNDGDSDLYLTCFGRDLLLRNDGGRFVEAGLQANLSQEIELGSGAAFFDADRDGWLDLYAARYVAWSPETDRHCALYGEGKSYCTAAVYEGVSGRFYSNRGDGTFEPRTREVGLFEPSAKALGVIAADFDNDGWEDLAIACDTVRNLLFHNRGDGTFEEVGLAAGVALSIDGKARGGMGIDAGDFEGNGRPGLAITYFTGEMVGLYRNLGEQFFLDSAPNQELGRRTLATLGWGVLFFDYDLDGRLDLLLANGHLDSKVDEVPGSERWAQPQQLFRNGGGGRFFEVTATAGGDLARPLVGRGAAFGDLDDDGDLDVLITTNGGPVHVFENRGAVGQWLRVDLKGTRSNRDGLGAVVTVKAGGQSQTRQLHSGGSYLSQSQISPVFGLGSSDLIDELTVQWPSGVLQRVTQIESDQRLELVEPAK